MLADRINAGNLQTKGTAGKLGDVTGERKETHPVLVSPTSTAQQGKERNAGEHSFATRGH